MNYKTLTSVLNNQLSLPQIIHCKNGSVRVKTSEKLIESKKVQVNGFTVTDTEFLVKSMDQVRLVNKRNDFFFVK